MIEGLKMIKEMEKVMKFDHNHIQNHKQPNQIVSGLRSKLMHSLTTILFLLAFAPFFVAAQPLAVTEQMSFATAEAAADKLYEVVVAKDASSVAALFGAEYLYLLPLDEIDAHDRSLFISAWDKSHKLIAGKKEEMFIEVGIVGWTFPIPLQKNEKGWYFDTVAGAEIVQTRRIGRNELSTMQAALAYYDAQKEYSEQDRNGDGVLEYAQQFISAPGKKDGLYWQVKPGETESPLGSLFANDTPEGAYHGYYYKILKAQGETARGGSYNYMLGDHMKYGFALVAWPAEYGDLGVVSFLISHDGVLYEKNLGTDTDQLVAEINSFDPGDGWFRSDETP